MEEEKHLDVLRYYYAEIFRSGDKPFCELSVRQRTKLENSTSFAIWMVSKKVDDLRDEINQVLSPLGRQLPPKFPKDRIG